MDCYEVEIIENSRSEAYQHLLQEYLNKGYKIHWCNITDTGYKYKAILIKDNEIVGNGTDNT